MARKKNTTQATNPTVTVHMPEMIAADLLTIIADNSNRQSPRVHEDLKASILEHGFDETLIVRPKGDGFYEVVSGNHRFMAGVAVGMTEFPCVVRDDWTEVEAQLQSVKRNYSRGKIDKDAFTKQVNKLASKEGLSLDDIMMGMGFEDADAFSEYYKQERKREEAAVREVSKASGSVKMVDGLGAVLSEIFANHGSTVPQSFIIFPAGGKNHMFVACTPALKRNMEAIAQKCAIDGLDINVALGGLLTIGIANSNFLSVDADTEMVRLSGEPDDDADLEVLK